MTGRRPTPFARLSPNYWRIRVVLAAAERHVTIGGIPIAIWGATEAEQTLCIERLTEAHSDLLRFAPRPRGLWGGYIERIAVWRTEEFRGVWHRSLGLCGLSLDFVIAPDTTSLAVASTIVHEAQHSRIDRFGRFGGFRWVERVERLCVGAEMAFLATAPGSETIAAQRRAHMEAIPDQYSPEGQRRRFIADGERLGMSRLTIRVSVALGWFAFTWGQIQFRRGRRRVKRRSPVG